MTELPLGGTVEDLRRLIALDAQRYGRKALRMHEEIERGVADEAFDRLELMRGAARASRYCWALVAVLGFTSTYAPSIGRGLAVLIEEVVTTGEPTDPALLDVEGLD